MCKANSTGDTVKKAVDASRPETSTQIVDSRQAVRDVSESQNDYCDTSAEADLVLGERAGIRIASADRSAATVCQGMKVWVPRGMSLLTS